MPKKRKSPRKTAGRRPLHAVRREPDLMHQVASALRGDPLELLGLASTMLCLIDEREQGPFRPPREVDRADLIDSFLEIERVETTALLTAFPALCGDQILTARIRRELARRSHPLPSWLTALAGRRETGPRCPHPPPGATDNFGLVTFDDSAQIVVPAGPLTDKAAAIRVVEAVTSGGSTDLSAGYLRGLREIRRVANRGGTVLVISDGHVNAGIDDPEEFAGVTSKAYADGVVTSTLGYGQGYDESLLAAIARAGNGNHVFADDPDAAGAAIAGEVDGLLNKVVQALSLTIVVKEAVQFARLYNDLPAQRIAPDRLMVELGDLFGTEQRKVLLKLRVPGMAALGLAKIATLELAYVELPG